MSNPVVGVWSANLGTVRGGPGGMAIAVFAADGRIQQRVAGATGQTDLFGRYRVSSDGRYLQALFTDFAPRMTCSASFCAPAPTPSLLFRQIDMPVKFLSLNQMQTQTPQGPVIWTRRQ